MIKTIFLLIFKRTQLRERLAKLEHKQWMHWTKWLVNRSDHDIPDELEEKWKKNWKPYEELTEEEKDKDRKWANKVLDELHAPDRKLWVAGLLVLGLLVVPMHTDQADGAIIVEFGEEPEYNGFYNGHIVKSEMPDNLSHPQRMDKKWCAYWTPDGCVKWYDSREAMIDAVWN